MRYLKEYKEFNEDAATLNEQEESIWDNFKKSVLRFFTSDSKASNKNSKVAKDIDVINGPHMLYLPHQQGPTGAAKLVKIIKGKEKLDPTLRSNMLNNMPASYPGYNTVKTGKDKAAVMAFLLYQRDTWKKLEAEALKEIKEKVVYDIVGPVFDADYWTACQNYLTTLPENIEVRYHGAVPPNQLIPFYESAHVFICPSQSENFGHAFFEALSAGKPLITSRNTPWNQLQENQIGYNVNVDVVEISTAIRFFISMDNKEYTIWSHQAAEFAMQYEGVKQAELAYKKMFES